MSPIDSPSLYFLKLCFVTDYRSNATPERCLPTPATHGRKRPSVAQGPYGALGAAV